MDGEFYYRVLGRTLVLGGLLFFSSLCWCADTEMRTYSSSSKVSVVFRGETPPTDKEEFLPIPTPQERDKITSEKNLSLPIPANSISITLRNPQDHSQQTKIWTAGPDYSFRQLVNESHKSEMPATAARLPERIARSLPRPSPASPSLVNIPVKSALKPTEAAAAQPIAVKPLVSTAAGPTLITRSVQTVDIPFAPVSPALLSATVPPLPQSSPRQIPLYQVSNQVSKDVIEPAPKPEAASSADLPPPPSIGGTPATASTAAQSTQKLGEEPRNYNLEFLRRQSVLLRPYEWQLDVGVSYLYDDHYFADISPLAVLLDARVRRRLLTVPMEFRYGLFERVQLFANMPFGWANTEYSYLGYDEFINNGGIGDTNAGGTFWIHESSGSGYSPDIVATFGLTAPTGEGNALLGILQSPETTLGQGYWAGYWNVLFIHQYDPVILYYGFGSRHYFARNIDITLEDEPLRVSAKPGDQYTYQLGVGFAVNERITLSTTFFGSFITDARLAGEVFEGTSLEPLYLRCAVTIARPPRRIVEPFVELGLTNDAADARAGITWTF
jgi:hypothetical protein